MNPLLVHPMDANGRGQGVESDIPKITAAAATKFGAFVASSMKPMLA
jgi:hypothetical protein